MQGTVVQGPPPWAVVKPWLMLLISIATWALAFYAPDLFSVVGALIVTGVALAPPFRNQIWPSIGSQAVALLGALVAIALGAAWQHANIELHLIVHTPHPTDESRVLYIVQFLYFIFYHLEIVICLSTAALGIILLLFCIKEVIAAIKSDSEQIHDNARVVAEAGRVCCAAFLTFGALALAVLINDLTEDTDVNAGRFVDWFAEEAKAVLYPRTTSSAKVFCAPPTANMTWCMSFLTAAPMSYGERKSLEKYSERSTRTADPLCAMFHARVLSDCLINRDVAIERPLCSVAFLVRLAALIGHMPHRTRSTGRVCRSDPAFQVWQITQVSNPQARPARPGCRNRPFGAVGRSSMTELTS